MSPEAWEVVGANGFPEERRRYFLDMAADAELMRSWHALEEEADRAQKRATAERWAGRLGLSPTEAPVLRVLLYARNRDQKRRAGKLICDALRLKRKAAA
jgi:hypothetical protein